MKQIISILEPVLASIQDILQAVALANIKSFSDIVCFLNRRGWAYQELEGNCFVIYAPKDIDPKILKKFEKITHHPWISCKTSQITKHDFAFKNKHLEAVLREAFHLKASDIFLTLTKIDAYLHFRKNNQFIQQKKIPLVQGNALLKSCLACCYLDFDATLRHQEGHFRYNLLGENVFCRLSYMASEVSQSLVLRLLSEAIFPFDINNLQLPQALFDLCIKKVRHWDSGMILISGATGSGKTTTLYALGKLFCSQDKKVISIEDPIEAEISDWTQTEVNPAANYTFHEALTAVLRQDPDVILLGEIRDKETAQAAFYASLSGYLVITTIHALTADTVQQRCAELGVDYTEFKDNVRMHIHQNKSSTHAAPVFLWQLSTI